MILRDCTELDHVQIFIGFCNAYCRAPRSYVLYSRVLGAKERLITRFYDSGPSELKVVP